MPGHAENVTEAWRLSIRPSLVVAIRSGRVLRANRAAEDFWGCNAADFPDRPLADFIDPDSAQAFLAAAAQSRAFASESVTIRQVSGAAHVVAFAAAPPKSAAAPDVWTLHFREPGPFGPARELRRLNFALNAYVRSSAALIQAGDTKSVMAQVCEAIVGQDAYILAAVALAPPDKSLWLDFAAAAGPAKAYLDGLKLTGSADLPEGQGATGRVVRTGVPYLIRDCAKDPLYTRWRERGARYGIRSTANVPISVAGETVGVLLVYASKPNAFGPMELNLFWRLCQAIGLALTMEADRRRLAEAEARAHAANDELQRLARFSFMGEFAAALAHEINQPLGATRINAQAALRWLNRPVPDLAETRAALERIDRDATRAHEIVARTRAMYGGGAACVERFDLRQAVEEVLAMTRDQRKSAGVELRASLDHPGLVLGDRTQAQQVVFNLVANAADALSGVAGRPRRLAVALRRQPGKALVRIEDEGPGVEEAAKERLFERFFTTKPHGTGLGLALSRRIVEAQGGRLWFEPVEPQGARFQFTLPLAPP